MINIRKLWSPYLLNRLLDYIAIQCNNSLLIPRDLINFGEVSIEKQIKTYNYWRIVSKLLKKVYGVGDIVGVVFLIS